jgi:hypothetical protein
MLFKKDLWVDNNRFFQFKNVMAEIKLKRHIENKIE